MAPALSLHQLQTALSLMIHERECGDHRGRQRWREHGEQRKKGGKPRDGESKVNTGRKEENPEMERAW